MNINTLLKSIGLSCFCMIPLSGRVSGTPTIHSENIGSLSYQLFQMLAHLIIHNTQQPTNQQHKNPNKRKSLYIH